VTSEYGLRHGGAHFGPGPGVRRGQACADPTSRCPRNSDPRQNRFAYSETWTNLTTGKWFVIRGQVLFNEVEATHVEGSIFQFRFVEAGQPFVVEDSEGNVVERNSGSVHVTYLFDTQGDDQPGGEWVADVDFWIAGPHPSIDKHPCEYAVELIG
jgi:hypothetical protein